MDALVIAKFWAGVEKTDACWLWTGYLDKLGLPVIRTGIASKGTFLHSYPRRITLELAGISVPYKSQVVITCANRLCLNPLHLAHGDEARFWNKVQKLSAANGSCWVWTGDQDKDMYGRFKIAGKTVRAHRYSYELYIGHSVSESVLLCHTCDHPWCVNPQHLFPGSHADNHTDKTQKERQAKGETIASSKLTDDEVRLMRELKLAGETTIQLSQKFSVGKTTVLEVVSGKRWKHVT